MPVTDARIDTYIDKAADFAKPVLTHIRKLVHQACPQATETIKWGMPYFDYNGSILCGMAAFRQHCALVFFKASLMKDPEKLFNKDGKKAMGQFNRIGAVKDLPANKMLISYIKEAALLNEAGVKKSTASKTTSVDISIPDELAVALKQHTKAAGAFNKLPPSHKKKYITWIMEAKTTLTRNKRVATTIAWLLDGKSRNGKYKSKQ